MEETIQGKKQEVFDGMFGKRVLVHHTTKDGKKVDAELVCRDIILGNIIHKLYRRQSDHSLQDFISGAAVVAWETIEAFEPQTSTWMDMSKRDLGALFKSVNIAVQKRAKDFAVSDTLRVRERENGGRTNHSLSLNMIRLESLAAPSEEEDVYAVLGDNASLYGDKGAAHASHFLEWFRENQEQLLTRKQNEFYEAAQKCWHEKGSGYTENDIEAYTGVDPEFAFRYYKRIESRVLKAWLGEEKKSFAQRIRERELRTLQGLIDIYEAEDEDMNLRMSIWFYNLEESDAVGDIIADVLDGKETQGYVAARDANICMPSRSLYKLYAAVEDRVHHLHRPLPARHKMEIRPGENNFDRERHDAYKAYKRELLNPPLYVNGVETEAPKNPFKKKKKTMTMLPTGLMYELLEDDVS